MSSWEASGKTDEWFTPPYIFDALGCRFDLDVAHPHDRATYVPATRMISKDSLAAEWRGFVWMNPPYGGRNGLQPWLEKFVAHGNGLALVPDRTSAPWFQWMAPRVDAALFVAPKIKFVRPDGTVGESPGTGSALIAKGPRAVAALCHGRSLGWLTMNFPALSFEEIAA